MLFVFHTDMLAVSLVVILPCAFAIPLVVSQLYLCNLAQIKPKHLPLAHGAYLVRSYLVPAHSMRIAYYNLQARLIAYRA